MHDIIPDIHGQADKLDCLIKRLGWRQTAAGWRNDVPDREIVFLGDFIDRGCENARVLKTVKSLIDAGKARAVMGNHELNAIQFHTPSREPCRTHLRAHSEKNTQQHATFLREFPVGASETNDAIAWMKTLPLFLETDGFRAVHACWREETIDELRRVTQQGVLSEEQLHQAASDTEPLFELVEITAKGPEADLPEGCSFFDKDGVERRYARLRWWQKASRRWVDHAISVPNPDELRDTDVPGTLMDLTYPADAKPVFFGHYWFTGEPQLQAPNALCLDYSAGMHGPLLAYRFEGPGPLNLANIVAVP